jgi:hypothetical protein
MACAILFALAMLIIQLSTGDLKVSARSVGDKKALSAAETGIHQMIQSINRLQVVNKDTLNTIQETKQVNAAADPSSRYTVGSIADIPGESRAKRSLPGYSDWEQQCYVGSVTGVNTNYNSSVTIDVGIGYAIPTEPYR